MILVSSTAMAQDKPAPVVLSMNSINSLMGEIKTAEKRIDRVQKESKNLKDDDFKKVSDAELQRQKMMCEVGLGRMKTLSQAKELVSSVVVVPVRPLLQIQMS